MSARAGEGQPGLSAAAKFNPLEHDVDTGGVSDHIFALSHLLSQSLVPHLCDFPDRQDGTFRPSHLRQQDCGASADVANRNRLAADVGTATVAAVTSGSATANPCLVLIM